MLKSQLTIISLATFLLIGTGNAAQADSSCTEAVQANCTSCHYPARICRNLGKKSKRAWKSTVKRMVRYGLKADQKTREKIIACLADLEAGDPGICQTK